MLAYSNFRDIPSPLKLEKEAQYEEHAELFSAFPHKEQLAFSASIDRAFMAQQVRLRFRSDDDGCIIEIPMEKETAALGAACIAGITTGALESPESMREKSKIKRIYEPNMSSDERESKLYQWNRAVKRSMEWAER
jgi:glycerol kinase